MARARNIKPGFFMNDKLAEIEALGRILFAGLWTIADREGRLEDRPKKIKASILPYDDCDIDRLLQALHNAGFIYRYEVAEQNYIQITKFKKHQNPHPKEAQSIIPAIPYEATNKQVISNVQESEEQIENNADSLIPLILISDSPTPFTPAEEVHAHWNNQKIIIHDKMTPDMENAINKALKDSTKEEIETSITHFAAMLHDVNYEICSYKWDLTTFLQRKLGYKQFMNDGAKWINYQDYCNGRASPSLTKGDQSTIIDSVIGGMDGE